MEPGSEKEIAPIEAFKNSSVSDKPDIEEKKSDEKPETSEIINNSEEKQQDPAIEKQSEEVKENITETVVKEPENLSKTEEKQKDDALESEKKIEDSLVEKNPNETLTVEEHSLTGASSSIKIETNDSNTEKVVEEEKVLNESLKDSESKLLTLQISEPSLLVQEENKTESEKLVLESELKLKEEEMALLETNLQNIQSEILPNQENILLPNEEDESIPPPNEEDENIPPPPQILFREPSSSDPEAPESTHNYFQHLGSLRLQMSDWGPDQLSNYCYSDSPLAQEGLARINKEIKSLTRALPCEPSGAVFVHIDSSNLSRLKALISGTEDTPYEHGLFLFDIKLDTNYPASPPKMTIKTTGNGSIRFNPNLYDSGYVCLSIINTWGGDPEEMWNPSYSTLMQVFLSIQALVMNNDVIQKEPGYEHMDTHCAENEDYAKIVRYGNITYAMIEMIRSPPEEFKEIVIKHFAIKKEKILQTVAKWVEESANMGEGFNDYILSCHNAMAITMFREKGSQNIFTEKYNELKIELQKLPNLSLDN